MLLSYFTLVSRYVKLFNLTGDTAPKAHRMLGEFEQLVLLRLIMDNPGIYLAEIQDNLFTNFSITCSASTICRTLKSMGCTRQKIQRIALQCSDECRARFMAEVSLYDPNMFVWIDETGCDRRNCMRRYGGLPPVITFSPWNKILCSIPVMSMHGIHDVEIVEGLKILHFLFTSCFKPV